MSSTNKTPLGFNQWILEDKPRMEDFNADNSLLDEKLTVVESSLADTNAQLANKANLLNPELIGVPTINGKFIAIAERPQRYNLSLASGIGPYEDNPCMYHRTDQNVVIVNFNIISKLGTGFFPARTTITISTLPEGFKPVGSVLAPLSGIRNSTSSAIATVLIGGYITTDGLIRAQIWYEDISRIGGTFVFIAR